jgi:hypothetical protein
LVFKNPFLVLVKIIIVAIIKGELEKKWQKEEVSKSIAKNIVSIGNQMLMI